VQRSQSAADIIQEELQKVESEIKKEAAIAPTKDVPLIKDDVNQPQKES